MKHEKQANGKRLHQRKVDFNLNTNITNIYQLCVPLFENVESQFIQKDILFKTSYISVCSKTNTK